MLARKEAILQKFEKHWESKTTNITGKSFQQNAHASHQSASHKRTHYRRKFDKQAIRFSYKGPSNCIMHIVRTQDFGLLWPPPSNLSRKHSPFWLFLANLWKASRRQNHNIMVQHPSNKMHTCLIRVHPTNDPLREEIWQTLNFPAR